MRRHQQPSCIFTYITILASLLCLSNSSSCLSTAQACSLEESASARRLVASQVLAQLESEFSIDKSELLPSCPLLPANDYFAAHEAFKTPWGSTKMKCSCGKFFRNEFYIDRHISERHRNSSKPNVGGFCLAKICSFMPCGGPDDALAFHPSKRGIQTCHMILNHCFPHSSKYTLAHESLESTFCQGKVRQATRSALGVLGRAMSWALAIFVFCWYLYSWWANRVAKGRGVGLQRVKLPPKPAPVPVTPPPAPHRRQQVGEQLSQHHSAV